MTVKSNKFLLSLSGLAISLISACNPVWAENWANVRGSWINALEAPKECKGISAGADVVGAADMDVQIIDSDGIEMTAVEYSAKYKVIRSRETEFGTTVIEASGVGYDLGSTTRLKAIWVLSKNSEQQDILTTIEWIEAEHVDGEEMPRAQIDPPPYTAVFIRCSN